MLKTKNKKKKNAAKYLNDEFILIEHRKEPHDLEKQTFF